MSEFVRVAAVSDLADPGRMLVEVGDEMIVVFRVGGEFFALEDRCTHDDGPLSDGELEDHTIACPRHGAKFCIKTGAALTMPARKPTRSFAVKIDGDDILVATSH